MEKFHEQQIWVMTQVWERKEVKVDGLGEHDNLWEKGVYIQFVEWFKDEYLLSVDGMPIAWMESRKSRAWDEHSW